ncbi:hypothetical protein [Aeromicrobium sp. P5_D10]
MTSHFRIVSIRLDTTNGQLEHSFSSDLSVLAGHTGVGKTTLLELVKHVLGGDAMLAPVVKESVTDVHLNVQVGNESFQLSRSTDANGMKKIRVVDLMTRERLGDRNVDSREPSISTLLLESLGLEAGMKAAARSGRSAKPGAAITFNDVFQYMYVPQSAINREIAKSNDGYYEPKRKAVFEVLFGLTDSEILGQWSEFNRLKGQIESATHEFQTVNQFLESSGLTDRLDVEILLAKAVADQQEAEAEIASLRDELAPASDRETQLLREMLGSAEQALTEANRMAVDLARERQEYASEKNRVRSELGRLARMSDAGERLASIEFSVCPRCTQRLDARQVAPELCRVCLQADVVPGHNHELQYESEQLTVQLAELEDQLNVIDQRASETQRVQFSRSELISSIAEQIEVRTSTRVSPRLQAFADATAKQQRAIVQQEFLEQTLRQWDHADDLGQEAERLTLRRNRLKLDAESGQARLSQRKTEVIAELSEELQSTVLAFGIPSVESAVINPDTYLPMINGLVFDEVSSGGGIITSTQVAYWLSLLTVANRRFDCPYPAFLMIDSPRLALNNQDDIAAQMYRRFVTQADATPGRLQFIVADNAIPDRYGQEFSEIDFDYDHPTISTIAHPGLAAVTTLVPEPE